MRVKNEGVSNCANCHKSDWSRRFPFPGVDPGPGRREALAAQEAQAHRAQLDAALAMLLSRKRESTRAASPELNAATAAQPLPSEGKERVRTVHEKKSNEPQRAFLTSSRTRLPIASHAPLRARHLIPVVAVVAGSALAIALALAPGGSAPQTTAETAARPAPTTTVTVTATATATATETVTASPSEQAETQPAEPVVEPEPTKRVPSVRTKPTPQSTHSDSPGRHDGSNYDNLSPEGQEAHDTLNCADVPGHKKGSCNEPNRKCNLDGAQVTSSGGIRLTCQMAGDGRLRWLA
ncbi:hypothetical protein ACWDAO_00695 [Streptomyces sp. NPDC001212]